jgi:hypothetical protein
MLQRLVGAAAVEAEIERVRSSSRAVGASRMPQAFAVAPARSTNADRRILKNAKRVRPVDVVNSTSTCPLRLNEQSQRCRTQDFDRRM